MGTRLQDGKMLGTHPTRKKSGLLDSKQSLSTHMQNVSEMQQMPWKILDLGLKCYLRILDVQPCKSLMKFLIKNLDMIFHDEKE